MSKLKRVTVAFVALSLSMVVAARTNAQTTTGCKAGKFVGSYLHTDTFPDIWGDGSGITHKFILQLNLNSDGTATQGFTGLPDLMLSAGSGTPYVGSWTCRSDGKLVVTLLSSAHLPTTDAINHPLTVQDPPPVDLFLFLTTRTTYLFTVTDGNTLTKIQARARRYAPAEDPSDPAGGTLGPLATGVSVYKRLVASDADLLAP
jgi:hypothetical protein